jgi:hypothetical protein
MESILKFTTTFTDKTQEVQELHVSDIPNPQALDAFVMQALNQYANIGLVKKLVQENKYVLIPCGQIARVEVDLPSIAIASALDVKALGQVADHVKPMSQAADYVRRIS